MTSQQLDLWERLEHYNPDAAVAFPFSKRLARDNGWSLPYASRVVHEYKRFALLALEAGHPVTPSDQVDQAWHLHLLYTQSYWRGFCGGVLRRPLHHGPTEGGDREWDKFNDWYARTLASYRAIFGGDPPADIWPAAAQRFGDDIHFARVNTVRNWVVPKPVWLRSADCAIALGRRSLARYWSLGAAGLIAALVLAGCTSVGPLGAAGRWPFDLTAGPFLLFFIIAWTAIVGCAALLRWKALVPTEAPHEPLPALDAYDMGFLAGGRNRALFAAVASLTHRGALHLDEKEHRLSRQLLPDGAHPFEVSVYQTVAPHNGSTFKDLSSNWPFCAQVEEKLERLGLLTAERQRANTCTIPMLVALIVPAIGLVKIVVGIERDMPVGVLIVLSVIALVVALMFGTRPHRTRRGDEVLARLRKRHAAPQPKDLERLGQADGGTLRLAALPLAVGLFGPTVLHGTALAKLEEKLQANTGGNAGGGCGGGCGGCSGCGG